MAIKNLGRFEIIGEIGSGGMGVVYKGRDPKINRLVALKVVRPVMGSAKSAEQEQAISRFHIEAQAAGQLSHPNIVTIYDVGEEVTPDETLVYIAMEFLNGKGLDHYIYQKTFTTLEQKIKVVRQIAEGLDYAHKRGVVHRDVKPANVIMTDEGVPKLTDFGLARLSDSSLTMSGTILGTPNYMSPEQVQGKKVDARSDFFSLTVVLYEMITNEKPFAADSITSVIYKVVHEDPVPPRRLNANLPNILDAFVRKGLAKNPDSRFQTGADYLKGLDSILSGDETEGNILGDTTLVMDSKSSPAQRKNGSSVSFAKKSNGVYIGAGVGLVVAVALIFMLFSGGKKPVETVKPEQPAATPSQVASKAAEPENKGEPAAQPSAPATTEKPTATAVSLSTATATAPAEQKAEKKEVAPVKPSTHAAVEKPAATAVSPSTAPGAESKKEPKTAKREDSAAKQSSPAKPEPDKKPAKEKEPGKEEKPHTAKASSGAPLEEGILAVSSEPVGAEVFIENKFVGLTPINSLKHSQGELNLRVTKQGYQVYTKKVTLSDKASLVVALIKSSDNGHPVATEPSAPHEGQSTASSTTGGLEIQAPAESVIYVDGREFKEARVELKDLSSGTHLVYVQLKGKSPYTNRVSIKPGETTKIDLR
jgi:serine/threonine protein kinase